jgi:hypothetical protein
MSANMEDIEAPTMQGDEAALMAAFLKAAASTSASAAASAVPHTAYHKSTPVPSDKKTSTPPAAVFGSGVTSPLPTPTPTHPGLPKESAVVKKVVKTVKKEAVPSSAMDPPLYAKKEATTVDGKHVGVKLEYMKKGKAKSGPLDEETSKVLSSALSSSAYLTAKARREEKLVAVIPSDKDMEKLTKQMATTVVTFISRLQILKDWKYLVIENGLSMYGIKKMFDGGLSTHGVFIESRKGEILMRAWDGDVRHMMVSKQKEPYGDLKQEYRLSEEFMMRKKLMCDKIAQIKIWYADNGTSEDDMKHTLAVESDGKYAAFQTVSITMDDCCVLFSDLMIKWLGHHALQESFQYYNWEARTAEDPIPRQFISIDELLVCCIGVQDHTSFGGSGRTSEANRQNDMLAMQILVNMATYVRDQLVFKHINILAGQKQAAKNYSKALEGQNKQLKAENAQKDQRIAQLEAMLAAKK